MKKYMIRSDIEGATGVVSYEQAEPSKSEYAFGRRMFMSDLKAGVDGLNAGGADEIVIYDEHYYGRNVDLDELPDNVSVVSGKPPYRRDWAGGLDESFAGMILLGLHSKYSNADGLLHHTYELDIYEIKLNGISVGEIGMEAAIAGDYDVPLLLVTGDSAAIEEAQALIPGVAGVIVKESISSAGARCYPPCTTRARIFELARGVAQNAPPVKPFKLGNTIEMEIAFNPGAYLETLGKCFPSVMTSQNNIRLLGPSVTEVWAEYWALKLDVQERMKGLP